MLKSVEFPQSVKSPGACVWSSEHPGVGVAVVPLAGKA